MARVSIVVPFHWMTDWEYFLIRCLASIDSQTFKDYEVILTKAGTMPENTNRAIKSATGELIKVMYMDDYFAHPRALQEIVESFKGDWLVTGCDHQTGESMPERPHLPTLGGLEKNENSIGSPSVLTIRNGVDVWFDEKLSWMLDVDFYKRMLDKYGSPVLLNDINVTIGVHEGQMTHILTDEEKLKEVEYINKKYE